MGFGEMDVREDSGEGGREARDRNSEGMGVRTSILMVDSLDSEPLPMRWALRRGFSNLLHHVSGGRM